MKKQNFTGIFLLFLLAAGLVATLYALPAMRAKTAPLSLNGWIKGDSQKAVEKAYDESVPYHNASVAMWGEMGYVLFGEGRAGVLIGSDGWLFSAEEFARGDAFQTTIESNLVRIATVKEKLDAAKISLLVIPVPSKARVYGDHLGRYQFPDYWQAQYDKFTGFLTRHNIAHANLLPVFERAKAKEQLFLRTDTHWAPEGARRAAMVVAARIVTDFPYLSLPRKEYALVPGKTETHDGDLMRYVPVGAPAAEYGLGPDRIRRFTLDMPGPQDLFADDAPPVVLIGTSYSADERWGFETFLKHALQADILNRADEGQGPFTVMDDYLASDLFKNTPPRLVLWEIPERYLPQGADTAP